MIKQVSAIVLMISLVTWGCGSDSSQQTAEETSKEEQTHEKGQDHDGEAKAVDSEYGQQFGEKVTPGGAVSFEEMVDQMEAKDSIDVKVRAEVDAVCQKKGCWMNVTSIEQPMPDSFFVRFEDYGFFMPKDIAGRQVIMKGKAYRQVTPVDELRHYAMDAGKSPEEVQKITEPKEEAKFLATGVLLLPEESAAGEQ